MPKIFISYRRDDAEDIAARIYDRLTDHFDVVFDVDAVPIGVDFREYLNSQVVQCDALLAIIGRSWLTVVDEDGGRRLDNPRDFLRIEIESAVRAKRPVVPVLVRQAAMPEEGDLPETLSFLAFVNAARVASGRDFETHVQDLIEGVEALLSKSVAPETAASLPPVSKRSRQADDQDPRTEPVEASPGAQLLAHLKDKASELLPNTTWSGRSSGWWTLGSASGLHLLRAKPTTNTLRLRIRKNQSRRTSHAVNARGWIYETRDSTLRSGADLERALDVFAEEWL